MMRPTGETARVWAKLAGPTADRLRVDETYPYFGLYPNEVFEARRHLADALCDPGLLFDVLYREVEVEAPLWAFEIAFDEFKTPNGGAAVCGLYAFVFARDAETATMLTLIFEG